MRMIFALCASLMFFGGAIAYEDCNCCCNSGAVSYSDGRPVGEIRPSGDGYFLRNGKVMFSQNGQVSEINQEVTLDNGVRLTPDGFLVYRDGRRVAFRNDSFLARDGRMSQIAPAPNGQNMAQNQNAQNTRDGFFLRNGKVVAFRNGNTSEMTAEMTLADGSRLQPDGSIIAKNGARSKLGENEWLSANGRTNQTVATRPEVEPQNASVDRDKNAQPDATRHQNVQPNDNTRNQNAQPNDNARNPSAQPNDNTRNQNGRNNQPNNPNDNTRSNQNAQPNDNTRRDNQKQ